MDKNPQSLLLDTHFQECYFNISNYGKSINHILCQFYFLVDLGQQCVQYYLMHALIQIVNSISI